ncbi:MAG: RES domain-containing protein [Bacteroidales bacterium]|nr:RES domain-containing protein [Bacteroidales bacterium]MCF8405238.1 RES domain-containing protein [Bacteroidales bacterium]
MYVCLNCFSDLELKSYIDSSSKEVGECSFCKTKAIRILAIEELLDFFTELLDLFVQNSDGNELRVFIQNDWNLFANDAIATEILKGIFGKIDHSLNTPDDKVSYVPEIDENISFWIQLKEDVKWQRRYLLDLKSFEDFGWDSFFYGTVTYNNSERFYRARIHNNENESIYSIEKMGPPSKDKVGSGRANPQGIPYLYLSKTTKTTLFETRALFQDEVSVGEFKVRDGFEIDIVDFTEPLSAFVGSGNLVEYTKRIQLKRLIGKDLSKPIRRYDSDIEYIPTQFICEYVRYIIGADGILFNSSLDLYGQNIVLFNQDKMECINVRKYIVSRLDIEFEEITP